MAANIGNALRDDLLTRLDTTFPAGATLKIYTGARPSATTDAATGTLLCTITLPATPWAAASANSKAKNGLWEANAGASGTAGWARLANAGDTIRVDLTITVTGGGGDITMASTTVTSAKKVTIDTLVVSV